jgi:hypothetical protein
VSLAGRRDARTGAAEEDEANGAFERAVVQRLLGGFGERVNVEIPAPHVDGDGAGRQRDAVCECRCRQSGRERGAELRHARVDWQRRVEDDVRHLDVRAGNLPEQVGDVQEHPGTCLERPPGSNRSLEGDTREYRRDDTRADGTGHVIEGAGEPADDLIEQK